jgi:hypothetical protein
MRPARCCLAAALSAYGGACNQPAPPPAPRFVQVKILFWDSLKASNRLASQVREKAKMAAGRA